MERQTETERKSRARMQRTGIGALLLASLVGACQPSQPEQATAPMQQAHVAGEPGTHEDPTVDSAFVEFDHWVARHGRGRPDGTAVARGAEIAARRRQALAALVHARPGEAVARAISPEVYAALPPGIRRHVEQPLDGTGDYFVSVATGIDPVTKRLARAEVKRELRIDGKSYDAHVFGRRLGNATKRGIPVHGFILDDSLALLEEPARRLSPRGTTPVIANIGGETLTFATEAAFTSYVAEQQKRESTPGPTAATTAASSWTEGAKRILYVRIDFSDRPGEPVSLSAAQASMVETNTFYVENSYGKTSMTTTYTPVLRMPQPSTFYVNDPYLLLDHARTAAVAAGHDWRTYDFDVLAFTHIGYWWAGLGYVGDKGSWLQGEFNLRVTGHELGHNFGVWHANRFQTTDYTPIGEGTSMEYGNWFDLMGSGSSLENNFNAAFKQYFNWLTATDVQTITTSGTYRVRAHDFRTATGIRALRINKDYRDYVIEHRQRIANPWLQNGVVLTLAQSNAPNDLIDMTPGDWYSAENAPLQLGQTFADKSLGLYVTPVAKAGSAPGTMDVVVNFGAFASNAAPTATVTASATNVAVGATVTFTATATDPNGDTLAYYWNFDDRAGSTNARQVTKSFTDPGLYAVRCVVSDMKGGTFSKNILVSVGSHSERVISGTVTDQAGRPAADVGVGIDGWHVAFTDSSGVYFAPLYEGPYTLTPKKPGSVLVPASRTVSLSGGNVSGVNFRLAPPPVRIEAGGPYDYYDVNGQVWAADNGFTGGIVVDRGSIEIANTDDDRLYQTERFSMSGYAVTVPNASYEVRLHFAETYDGITASGQRVFHANVEGTEIRNIDVYAATGGRNRAHVRSVNVKVTDGVLNVGFATVVQNAFVNAIEILPYVEQLPVRVEAGGSASFTDSARNSWSADGSFLGGTAVDRGAIAIANTVEDRLYQTERFGMSGYAFPVANGRYTVRLHFAETWTGITAAGQRVFNVNVEGTARNGLDIFARAGGRDRAWVETFTATVLDGRLDVGFTAVTQNPLVNAIEVLPLW